ncbi:DUF350 domain-containing protein [Oceanirhabdus sp. W0125-5]|uniref:DUF350 domain-containing protein n=1 Tax=Oceanirhabdus sp. W0125-5 TaxID=2999116 RepID=UPI0022F2ACE1|nr:DUF350 domain-containing protein [Oceanirhabdus sp. W0125-5]WBW95897.1 DUF350 domain-containing protein [Oceanirhabdus sp. W0125-5]
MLMDILSIVVYFVLGMLLCLVGYKMFDVITPFDLQKELDDHNLGAGFAIAGMFIGIAIIIGGVILP